MSLQGDMQNMRIESKAISASAGSGKTYALTLRFIQLLYCDVNPQDILCLTFTRKAAREMKERILGRIFQLADSEGINSKDAEEFIGQLGLNMKKEEIRSKAIRIYRNLYSSSLNIMTIDAFFLSILRLFTFEASVPFGFDVASENERKRYLQESVKKFSSRILSEDKLKRFLFETANSLDTSGNIIQFIANRIAPLIDIAAEIEEINTENKNTAAASLENLIKARESLCEFLLKHREKWGRSRNKAEEFCDENLKPLEFLSLLDKKLTENRNFAKAELKDELQEKWLRFEREAERYLNSLIESESSRFIEIFRRLHSSYEDVIREKGKLSFPDIAGRVYRLLVNAKDPEPLYFRLDMRIRHLLIDEFQDTSFTQWLILKPLVDELLSGQGVKDEQGSLFYVGDKKQSIYRFRGAESNLFDVPQKEYKDRIIRESLNVNRRSSMAIVEFLNNLFCRLETTLFPYEAVQAHSEEEGYVKVEEVPEKEELLMKLKQEIANLQKMGRKLSDITVLVRTNSDVDAIASYLKDESNSGYSIPAITETTSSVRDTDVGRCVISALKYLIEEQKIHLETLKAYLNTDTLEDAIRSLKNAINTLPNSMITKKIMESTGIAYAFKEDSNMLTILELASYLDDLDFHSFIVELERLMMDTPQAGDRLYEGVRIMTIHKSKGLEFNTVIVPLLPFTIRPEYGLRLVRNPDTLKAEKFLINIKKNMGIYSKEIAQAIKNEEEKTLIDELNILYVALTRAKRELLIFGVTKRNKIAKKLFDTLRTIYDKREDAFAIEIGKPVKERRKKMLPQKTVHHLRTITDKKRKMTEENEEIGNLKERLFGEVVHKTLELSDIFDENSVDEAIEKIKPAYRLYITEKEFEKAKDLCKTLIRDGKFKDLIAKAERIEKEKPFVIDGEIRRVDLIAFFPNTIRVVDYKTAPADREIYRKQVEEYCFLLNKIYRKPAEGYLVFLRENAPAIAEVARIG